MRWYTTCCILVYVPSALRPLNPPVKISSNLACTCTFSCGNFSEQSCTLERLNCREVWQRRSTLDNQDGGDGGDGGETPPPPTTAPTATRARRLKNCRTLRPLIVNRVEMSCFLTRTTLGGGILRTCAHVKFFENVKIHKIFGCTGRRGGGVDDKTSGGGSAVGAAIGVNSISLNYCITRG